MPKKKRTRTTIIRNHAIMNRNKHCKARNTKNKTTNVRNIRKRNHKECNRNKIIYIPSWFDRTREIKHSSKQPNSSVSTEQDHIPITYYTQSKQTNHQTYFNRSLDFEKSDHLNEALDEINQCLELNHAFGKAYIVKSRILNKKGLQLQQQNHFNQAILCFSDAITCHVNSALYGNRCHVLIMVHDYAHAVMDADQYIKLEPHCWRGYVLKSKALLGQSKHSNALEVATQGIESCGSVDELQRWMEKLIDCTRMYNDVNECGLTKEQLEMINNTNNLDEAIQCWTQLIETHAMDRVESGRVLYWRRSFCYRQMGVLDKALQDINHCLELDSDWQYAHKAKAVILTGQGEEEFKANNVKSAILCYSDAISCFSGARCAYYSRAIAYSAIGCYSKALRDTEKYCELNSTHEDGYLLQAQLWMKLHQYSNVLHIIKTGIELSDSSEILKSYLEWVEHRLISIYAQRAHTFIATNDIYDIHLVPGLHDSVYLLFRMLLFESPDEILQQMEEWKSKYEDNKDVSTVPNSYLRMLSGEGKDLERFEDLYKSKILIKE
eukprot:37984_1